ncbi:hypothetical protein CEXT_533371 [Caerostris extrusa]|uniref:Uncharacterized protein n=1 Tax=Caerostris extrusa TaxID=172846 RepID=A0AAV4PMG6_CAEEX|nr:hypothetical protein CEXT_533371 [Caerostris extrusa]
MSQKKTHLSKSDVCDGKGLFQVCGMPTVKINPIRGKMDFAFNKTSDNLHGCIRRFITTPSEDFPLSDNRRNTDLKWSFSCSNRDLSRPESRFDEETDSYEVVKLSEEDSPWENMLSTAIKCEMCLFAFLIQQKNLQRRDI